MTTPLLKVPDLAARLSISRAHAYDLVASGAIEVVRVGRSVRVSEQAVQDYLTAHTTPALKRTA